MFALITKNVGPFTSLDDLTDVRAVQVTARMAGVATGYELMLRMLDGNNGQECEAIEVRSCSVGDAINGCGGIETALRPECYGVLPQITPTARTELMEHDGKRIIVSNDIGQLFVILTNFGAEMLPHAVGKGFLEYTNSAGALGKWPMYMATSLVDFTNEENKAHMFILDDLYPPEEELETVDLRVLESVAHGVVYSPIEEVTGDQVSSLSESVPFEEKPAGTEFMPMGIEPDSNVNVSGFRTETSLIKATAVADCVALTVGPREGTVVILGGSPGRMGKCLTAKGFHVVEVDRQDDRGHMANAPDFVNLNITRDMTAEAILNRIKLERSGVGTVIIDLSHDSRSAVADTERNAQLATQFLRMGKRCLVKVRDKPPVGLVYHMLSLPGHEARGREMFGWATFPPGAADEVVSLSVGEGGLAFASSSDQHAVPVKKVVADALCSAEIGVFAVVWPDGTSQRVVLTPGHSARFGAGYDRCARDLGSQDFECHSLTVGGVDVYEMQITGPGAWFRFISQRLGDVAIRAVRDNPLLALLDGGTSAITVHAVLKAVEPTAGEDVSAAIKVFENVLLGDGAKGIASDALAVDQTVLATMLARFENIAKYCWMPSKNYMFGEAEDLADLFDNPAAGALLGDMSALRPPGDIKGTQGKSGRTGDELMFKLATSSDLFGTTKYRLQLKLSHMPVLASKPLYVAVLALARARELTNYTMHGHELQHLLWLLSAVGTWRQKLIYVASLLREAIYGGGTVRSYQRSPGRRKQAAQRMLQVLSHMPGAEEKAQRLDPVFYGALQTWAGRDRGGGRRAGNSVASSSSVVSFGAGPSSVAASGGVDVRGWSNSAAAGAVVPGRQLPYGGTSPKKVGGSPRNTGIGVTPARVQMGRH